MTCIEKKRFDTLVEAETERFKHEAKWLVDKGELRTYQCP
jgi:hypothetical protein